MNKIYGWILGLFLVVMFCFSSCFSGDIYAAVGYGIESFSGEEIWMGWTYFESGTTSYSHAGGDGGRAYGRYQMDYAFALPEFLRKVYQSDPDTYSMLGKYLDIPAGDEGLLSKNGLGADWVNAYHVDPDGFSDSQDTYMYEKYYLNAKRILNVEHGIDLDAIGDPVLNGTVYSIAVRDGAESSQSLRAVWSTYTPGETVKEWLGRIYEKEAERHPDQSGRWNGSQKTAALSGGTTTAVLGFAGSSMASDGTLAQDFVAEWIRRYPEISRDFCLEGWSESNREWVRSLRGYSDPALNYQNGAYEIDFFKEYGITGGELQFSGATAGGISISGDAAAELFEIPDNGSSMPIPYFSQNRAPWSGLAFGDGNIGSSGCSITSAAMVFSYLIGGVIKENWISPADIRQSLITKYGTYNRFHVPGLGQGHDIFPALANIYGLSCSRIGSASIVAELAKGNPVIMSCKPSEFTSSGHFIVLTGLTENGYITVNDPNASHSAYSYKIYSPSYLVSCGKAWWSFSE